MTTSVISSMYFMIENFAGCLRLCFNDILRKTGVCIYESNSVHMNGVYFMTENFTGYI